MEYNYKATRQREWSNDRIHQCRRTRCRPPCPFRGGRVGRRVRTIATRSQAAAAARAVVGDGAIARGGRVRRVEDVLVIDDVVELALGLGAIFDRTGLKGLDPVLALVECAVVIGMIAVDRAGGVRAVEIACIASHRWLELDDLVRGAEGDGLLLGLCLLYTSPSP